MKRNTSLGLLLWLLMPLSLMAQSKMANVTLAVDKDTVMIGDMIHLHVEVEYAAQLNISGPGLSALPESEWLEYQGRPRITKKSTDSNARKYFVEDLDAMVFLDSGWVEIIPVMYEAMMPDTTYYFASNAVKVFVAPVVNITDIPEGLRTIIKEPKRLSDYYNLIFGILGLALLGAIVYYLRNRKPKEVVKEVPVVPVVAPDKEAILALKKIQKERLWETAPKDVQVSLSKILRRYLEKVYHVNALEASTREIDRNLKEVTTIQKAILMKLLNESDMVKFAKLTMPDEHQAQSIDDAITWVKRNTK